MESPDTYQLYLELNIAKLTKFASAQCLSYTPEFYEVRLYFMSGSEYRIWHEQNGTYAGVVASALAEVERHKLEMHLEFDEGSRVDGDFIEVDNEMTKGELIEFIKRKAGITSYDKFLASFCTSVEELLA